MQNAGKLAMVLGTRTVLLNSYHRFLSSFTQINSSPLSSLQCQLHTDASSGMWRGSNFPMQQHLVQSTMSRTYFPTEAGTPNANHAVKQMYMHSLRVSCMGRNRKLVFRSSNVDHGGCKLLYLGQTVPAGRRMAAIATADACDSNAALLLSGSLRALEPIFKIYGQCRAFSGPIVTLKVFEDNVLVRQLLEIRGEGRVLVIDGGGRTRCALVGGNMVQSAQNMGWAGIVVNGCVRDVDEINACDIGVRALGSNPLKSNKKAVGDKHVLIRIAGTLIHDGEWLYADSDGILIWKTELSV
ncbi:Ribonuclease E inhibitor RraA/Dimethylmenaquinone methyltransferase isoform 1 [Theobroma cacao]|uniref:4-hydroxy-4-methyl-2-oxoglutarate aldolase n=1 Tax=Theobroma cacao TaxID=3641 RepID=A0A061EMZ2_THECC|nr:Ribonuclease E inhibitor RraA/Dimethylmenaquinone methyltransferase isoform 1 [Theobroma cacao]